jgi:hypothetical protein
MWILLHCKKTTPMVWFLATRKESVTISIV